MCNIKDAYQNRPGGTGVENTKGFSAPAPVPGTGTRIALASSPWDHVSQVNLGRQEVALWLTAGANTAEKGTLSFCKTGLQTQLSERQTDHHRFGEKYRCNHGRREETEAKLIHKIESQGERSNILTSRKREKQHFALRKATSFPRARPTLN